MPGPLIQDQPVASTSAASSGFSFKNSSLEEVLEDLSSRFILNLPEEELVSVERICFQVEQAHWYYEDFIREEEPRFPSMALKTFSRHLFHACPLLQHWSRDHDQAFQDFLDYKTSVPVCGVIMLNPSWSKCVLVKGWKSSSSWSFPRGKINADEPERECAARETLEETGYDVSDKIIMDAVIRVTVKEQKTTLFVVPHVSEDTAFATRTRKEISKIDWFPLVDLPMWKKTSTNHTPNHKFYGIAPIVGPLKGIIKSLKKAEWERNNSQRTPQANATTEHTVRQEFPDDPAILSIQSKPEGDHLSRLLGGLDSSSQSTPVQPPAPVVILSRTTNSGALPTPQATPSAAAATKADLPVSPEGPGVIPKQAKQHHAFASPTPPHSGDSTKSHTKGQPPKPKFEFISPFDALASPPKKRAEEHPSADGQRLAPLPEVASASTSTEPGTSTLPSEISSDMKPGRPRAPSAAEHFAPPSIARARVRSRQPSQSSSASITSPMGSIANPSPLPERIAPNKLLLTKQAKHTALLQSLANDLFGKSSNSTPALAFESKPTFMDDRSDTAPPPMLLPNILQPNGGLPNPAQMNGNGYGGFFSASSSSASHGMNTHVTPAPIHSTPQVQMNGNGISYISHSRSVTPKVTYPPHDGGGPGSPIPVVPPPNPLQRDQLLSLLNRENGHNTKSPQHMPRFAMVPPQLARKQSYQPQPSLRAVPAGGPTSLQGAPTVLPLPHPATSNGGGSFPTAAPVPTPSAPPNPGLLSILNQPFPYR